MARGRDLPPDDDPRRRVPPEDLPTQPIDVTDPYVRDPHARERRVEEVYEEPPPDPRPWWRRNLWIWLLLLLLLVVGGLGLLWALQNDEGADRTVVPAVVGMSEAEAIREIRAAELEAVRNPGESDRPEGIVFAQTPGGGAQLEEGEPVVINVSTGPPTTTTVTTTTTTQTTTAEEPPPPPAPVTMPDVAGQSQADAGELLESEGLVADSYPVPSDEPAGTVISQRPAPGAELKEGDVVRLNVALGPDERETSDIPDLTGLEASEARQRARIEGFTVRTVFRRPPSQEEVGEVLTQSPAAGASAPILTQITLFVGR